MVIGRTKVRLAMLHAGLNTYSELARKVGCSRQNLSCIISRGSCAPATLAKFAAALGVEVEALLPDGEQVVR